MKKFLSILLCLFLVMSVFTVGFADDGPEERCCPPGHMRTLTVGMEGEGEVDPEEGDHEYPICSLVTLTATDTECWEFVRWEGDLGPYVCDCCDVDVRTVINPEDPEITVRMCCDRDITAVFRLKTRYLTVTSEGPGTTEPAGEDLPYDCGEVVDIVASSGMCGSFDHWEGDIGENSATDPSISVPMNMDRDIHAVFETIQYNLGISHEGEGYTTPTEGVHTYDCGTVVKLSARAAECYEFDYWEGDVASPSSAMTTVTMDASKRIRAVFAYVCTPQTVSLGISTEGNGTTTPTPGTHQYPVDEVVQLTAIPDDCWQFDHWVGDVASSSSASTTVTMDASKRVRAVFVPCSSCVELYVFVYDGNGVASPAGTTYHCIGEEVPLLATPDPGWEFVTWRGGDGGITSWLTEESSVIMPEGGTTVAAVFAPTGDCTLTVTYGDGGIASPAGVTVVSCGTVVDLEAIADPDWDFDYWTGPVADMYDPTTTVAVVENTTVHAVFYPEYVGEDYWLCIKIVGNGDVPWEDDYSSGVHDGDDETWHASGATVEFDPDPDSGWYFDEWTGTDGSSVVNDQITMDGNKEITAVFRRRPSSSSSSSGGIFIQHTLSISIEGSGSVEPFIGSKKYMPGTMVDLEQVAAAGWTFTGWLGPDGDDVINEQIEMDDDKTIIAHFEETVTPSPPAPPVEPPEIVIPLVETPLGGGELPDTSQAMPLANLLVGAYMIGLGIAIKKNKR